jgi:hypothetical protein
MALLYKKHLSSSTQDNSDDDSIPDDDQPMVHML